MNLNISPLETAYLTIWLLALFISATIVLNNRDKFEFLQAQYWQFISEPWKFITFIIAASIITFVAPYSGDPTWDYADSIIISVQTYALAPWALAVIVRSVRKRDWSGKLFVAFCMLMVPIWTYDLYILIRDQVYPLTWISNIPLSGAIVVSAGLFWNLTWKENVGVSFAFTDENWPPLWRTPFKRIAPYAFLIMIPVVLSVGLFLYDFFYG